MFKKAAVSRRSPYVEVAAKAENNAFFASIHSAVETIKVSVRAIVITL